MKIAKIVFWFVIIGLGYWLFTIIREPIKFAEERDKRYERVIERLKAIRTAEIAYKNVYNKYTESFDTLINFVKTDSFPVVRQIGNPDDTTQVLIRDTVMVSVRDSLFRGSYPVDSLRYIPFTDGSVFSLDAGMVERGNVRIPVFEAVDTDPFDKNKTLRVGSMTQPTNA
ncbi:MAG: hypothetical protein ACR2GN_08790, partial [Bacteroidia bacterium]